MNCSMFNSNPGLYALHAGNTPLPRLWHLSPNCFRYCQMSWGRGTKLTLAQCHCFSSTQESEKVLCRGGQLWRKWHFCKISSFTPPSSFQSLITETHTVVLSKYSVNLFNAEYKCVQVEPFLFFNVRVVGGGYHWIWIVWVQSDHPNFPGHFVYTEP